MPRYVVLHHTGAPDGDHFDLMLERGGALATWHVDSPALDNPRRIQDHRIDYLTYEGDISGGRGRVRRVAQGAYDIVSWTDAEVRVTIDGRLYSI